MLRTLAEKIVMGRSYKLNQYRVCDTSVAIELIVRHVSALAALKFTFDPLRYNGPTATTVYYWNVVDYLDEACALEKRFVRFA